MESLFQYELAGIAASLFEVFARAGGGGSESGGGEAFLVMVGYVPMHGAGALARKFKQHETQWVTSQVIGWTICAVYSIVLLALTPWFGFYALLMAVGAPIGMGAGLYNWYSKLRRNKKTEAALAAAAQTDRAWDEQALIAYTKQVFLRYQHDWTNYDTESMKTYMTPRYWHHAALMVYALQLAKRQNIMANSEIIESMVVEVLDNPGTDSDQVVVGVNAKAQDQTVDTRDNKLLFVDNKPFTEFYMFKRQGNTWLLDGIQQATQAQWTRNPELESFAASQGYYFSLDWGWLLIPSRGQLFGTAKFGTSDINNHVIGIYNKCLVQLYTYIPAPSRDSYNAYLIAQTNVPKTYGNIVVRRKKGILGWNFGGSVRGLNKVSMEWREFNDKYDVYASDVEQVTSFELLHPAFMEKLEALPFEVNIEVVDNVVYLYAPENKRSGVERYEVMLGILREAFKQMEL